MADLTLDQAEAIIMASLNHARALNLNPMTVAIVDTYGCLKLLRREDGPCPVLRPDIAIAKACAAIQLGPTGSRHWEVQFKDRPHFVQDLMHITHGRFLPGTGGVAILSEHGTPLGGMGCTGDLSDMDEAIAITGIQSAGLIACPDTPYAEPSEAGK